MRTCWEALRPMRDPSADDFPTIVHRTTSWQNAMLSGRQLGEGPMRERLVQRRSDEVVQWRRRPLRRWCRSQRLKLAQIVPISTLPLVAEVTEEQIAASDVGRCLLQLILLGQIHRPTYIFSSWLPNFLLPHQFKILPKSVSIESLYQDINCYYWYNKQC